MTMPTQNSTPSPNQPAAPATGRAASAPIVPAVEPGAELRASPRFHVDKDVEIRLLDDVLGRPVAARMVDLSAGGIGIQVKRPLARGREFVLVLPGGGPGNPNGLRYRVVRCLPQRDGDCLVGCSFIRAPSEVVRDFAKRTTDGDAASAA